MREKTYAILLFFPIAQMARNTGFDSEWHEFTIFDDGT